MRNKFWRRTVSLLCAAALLGAVTVQAAGTGDVSSASGEKTAAAPVAGFAAENMKTAVQTPAQQKEEAAAKPKEAAPQSKEAAVQPKEETKQPKEETKQRKEEAKPTKETASDPKAESSGPNTDGKSAKDAGTKETGTAGDQAAKDEAGKPAQEKAEVKEEAASSEEKETSGKKTSEKETSGKKNSEKETSGKKTSEEEAVSEEAETSDQEETTEPAADEEASARTETGEAQTEDASGTVENDGELSSDPEKATESAGAEEEESEAAETTEEAETETAVEEAEEKAEDPEPKEDDDTGEPKEAGTFSNVSIATDTRGAYFTYEFVNNSEKKASLDFILTDGSGNQVGSKTLTFDASSQDSGRIYILPLSDNLFGLSESDMGKSVSIRITAKNDIGETTASSGGSITLALPSISVPSIIGCAAADTARDLYDPAKIKGLSYDNGSFEVQRSVEKQNGGWSSVSDGKTITAADQGTYHICLHTVFGDYYSDSFQLVVPATDLSVSGEERVGNTLAAVVEGVDGVTPEGLTYAWTYGDSAEPVGTESSYTASLEDVVKAESLRLMITVKDLIGNEFSDVVNLKPMDISKAGLKAQIDEEMVYTGYSQVPEDAKILLDSFEVPDSLYTLTAPDDKNSENAGKAWVTVTGIEPYLTGSTDLPFTIEKAETELEEEDFETEFDWDGKKHKPLLSDDSDITGKLRYSKWKKLGADGSWKKISGAPSDPGTYRVNVTVKPKDKNYKKAVIEEIIFTITGTKSTSKTEKKAAKAPQKQAPDLTVTDAAGNARSYTAAAEILRDEEQKETGRIYKIKADPEKKADGTTETDENGKPVYRLRKLRISEDLVKKAKDAECTAIRFELGDAGLQISLDAITQKGIYTMTISPLEASELTSLELSAAAGYNRAGRFYAVKVTGPDGSVETAPEKGLSAYYRISDPSDAAGLLFLAENRDDLSGIPVVSDDTSEIVKENEILYITGTAAGSGIFCAVV